MKMTPTLGGYLLGVTPAPRPAHRAVMTARTAALNLEAKAGLDYGLHGLHYAPLTGATAWAAEEAAQEREILRVTR